MSGSYAARMHEQPFRATKYPVQPLASRKFVFGLRQKDLSSSCFITPTLGYVANDIHVRYGATRKLFSNLYTYFLLIGNSLL